MLIFRSFIFSLVHLGRFQLVDLIITEIKDHMICYDSMLLIMAIGVVEFSREGYKIRKVFA